MPEQSKRTVTRKIETRVTFTNDEVKALLLAAAGAPSDTTYAELQDEDGDAFYRGLEVVWYKTETETLP